QQMPSTLHRALAFVQSSFLITSVSSKSDVKSLLIPITAFAFSASPAPSASRLIHAGCWTLLHLLQCGLSKQLISGRENLYNRRHCALPSGRTSFRRAILLRWALVPLCWMLSLHYSTEIFLASLFLAASNAIYSECSAYASHWLVRNLVHAAGLASFEVGVTLIAGDRRTLDHVAALSISLSTIIFATTVQAQDFKDRHSDRALGRHTIPTALPLIARYTVIVPLLIWSGDLIFVWRLDSITACAFLCLAAFVGLRFVFLDSASADEVSYHWYNVWLSAAHLLPGYFRHHGYTL
ncbi:hypothetical protein FA95DRAFT_1555149, partial [Auriscalpium vulgare]